MVILFTQVQKIGHSNHNSNPESQIAVNIGGGDGSDSGLGSGIKALASEGTVFVFDAESPAPVNNASINMQRVPGLVMAAGNSFSLKMARANVGGAVGSVRTITGTISSRSGNVLTLNPTTGSNFTITLDAQNNMEKMAGASFMEDQLFLIPFENNPALFDGLWINHKPKKVCLLNGTGAHNTHNCNGDFPDRHRDWCEDSRGPCTGTMIVSGNNTKMYHRMVATGQSGVGDWSDCAYNRRGGTSHPLRGYVDTMQWNDLSVSVNGNTGSFTVTNISDWDWCTKATACAANTPWSSCTPAWVPQGEGITGTLSLSNRGNTLTVSFWNPMSNENEVEVFQRVRTN